MRTIILPCGKQHVIHGLAVNVPTDLTPVCTLLPRLASQTQMVPMELKRKLCYKGHYMYQYILAAKVHYEGEIAWAVMLLGPIQVSTLQNSEVSAFWGF